MLALEKPTLLSVEQKSRLHPAIICIDTYTLHNIVITIIITSSGQYYDINKTYMIDRYNKNLEDTSFTIYKVFHLNTFYILPKRTVKFLGDRGWTEGLDVL